MFSKDNNKNIEMGGITLSPGDRIGPYRYERPVGKGGMAEVVLAYDPSGHAVALKILKASRFRTGRRRFRREFRALAKLRHPNVIQVDSFGDIFGHPYFAMEYVEGTDLHNCIRGFRKKTLKQRWERTEQILIDLAQGLNYIHSKGLVHRDLKPSNVLIDKHGQCKITDFGIVKDLEPEDDTSVALVGTWAYASPEQICGLPLDNRSDLYSLGIILYAMLTGRRPFAAENMAGYLKLHRDHQPKAPSAFIPEIPERFEDICLKLLQKSPQDRFQSAQEILEALGFFLDDPDTEENHSWSLPFGGRVELKKDFEGVLYSLRDSAGCIIQLIGEDGLGKSYVINDCAQLAREQDLPCSSFSLTAGQGPFESVHTLAHHIAKESGHISLLEAKSF